MKRACIVACIFASDFRLFCLCPNLALSARTCAAGAMTDDVLVDRTQNTAAGIVSQSQQNWQQQHVSEFGSTFPVAKPSHHAYPGQVQNPSSRMHKTLPARPQNGQFASDRTPTSSVKNAVSSLFAQSGSGQADSLVLRPPPMYGYTPIGWDKQLDVPAAAELVLMCGEQIRTRGEWLLSRRKESGSKSD
jgi:hypothetical protein